VEVQLHAVEFEEALVLLDEGVTRLDQDLEQGLAVEVVYRGQDGEAADELGDHPELHQVLRHDLLELVLGLDLALGADRGAEADALGAGPGLDDLLQAGEGTADDEEDVRGVDLDEFL